MNSISTTQYKSTILICVGENVKEPWREAKIRFWRENTMKRQGNFSLKDHNQKLLVQINDVRDTKQRD